MSSSSMKSSAPLVRTRRVRFPRRRSTAPAHGTAPGRGPVDIGATVAGARFQPRGGSRTRLRREKRCRRPLGAATRLALRFLDLVLDVVAGADGLATFG